MISKLLQAIKTSFMRLFAWAIFSFIAILMGLYPLTYLIADHFSYFLELKSFDVLLNGLWLAAFYIHIVFGGVALATGWSQFNEKLRHKNVDFHRTVGKAYLISVFVSGISALYLATYATGGLIATMGYYTLALAWTGTSLQAYRVVRLGNIEGHRAWMIRSYALCWAAVMLRIWIPLLTHGFGLEVVTTYRIIAWLSWVPNLVVAEIVVRRLRAPQVSADKYQTEF
jgi:uncharacterized membrane protein